MQQVSPICRCQHPKRIVNPYTNQSLIVPCGHCRACSLNRSNRLSLQCDLESVSHKHCLFVTLTYSNRFIPRAHFVDNICSIGCCDVIDKSTGELLSECDLNISARISISYYISVQKPSYKYAQTLYLRVGRLVLSMPKLPKVKLLTMCRAMLIALALYPKFLKLVPSVRSAYILRGWVKAFWKVHERKYMKLPLRTLLEEACRSLISLRFLIYGGRVTLISTLNVEDLLIDLHTKLLTFIEYTTTPEERSQRLKLLSDLRKK